MIEEVKVIDGCISCRSCESICPKIFKVDPTSKVISSDFGGNESEIIQAKLLCPVSVIKVKQSGEFSFNFKKASIQEKNMLTEDTLELKLKTKDFDFKPGQYVSLQMKDWKGTFSRSYSIVSGNRNGFTLAIKLLEKGRGSNFLKKIKPGKKINFLGALGDFYLQNNCNKKVFIATGTGLAPMIAMLEETPKYIEKIVIFGVRFEKDLFYKDLLESFKNTKVIMKVSKPGDDFKGNKGRVTDHLNEIDLKSEVYICGNPNMVDSVRNGLKEKGHSEDLIFNEKFTIATEYTPLAKDIFMNGNIPFINIFSWIVILFGLVGTPLLWKIIPQNVFWDISWWAVVFVMVIRPLSDILPKLGILLGLNHLRKAFGILSSSIVIIALFLKFIGNPGEFCNYFSLSKWSLYYPIIGRFSEITGLILLITSNNFSQKKLGIWWKRIQRLAYIYFISGGIIASIYSPLKIYPAMGIVIIIWILAKLRVKIWK